MKTYVFPAYFRLLEGGEVSVDFPDLPGCVSAGDDLPSALAMAREALGLHLYGFQEDGDEVPTPSGPERIQPIEDGFIALVEGRPDLAADAIRQQAVKKTLTIPRWLNEEAMRQRINFSQVLQEALRDRVGV